MMLTGLKTLSTSKKGLKRSAGQSTQRNTFMDNKVVITQYKWAGQLGPFKIRSTCEECDVTTHRLKKIIKENFQNRPVVFDLKPWMDNAFYCLSKGTFHPPIIIINGKKFYQFSHKNPAFDQNKLIQAINELLAKENS